MNRMWAIVERELRKFLRSPALMLVSMVFPLIQLIILGNAFGGKIQNAKLGVVDQDGGVQALKVREAFDSVRATVRTFEPVYYQSEKQAIQDVRNGKIDGRARSHAEFVAKIGIVVEEADESPRPRLLRPRSAAAPAPSTSSAAPA